MSHRHNIKCLIAYEGTHYLGWQKTRAGPSVEESLEKVLAQVLQESLSLQAASRTDRGVHAEGQVINFFSHKDKIDLQRLKKSINALLPDDIRLLQADIASETFHPSLDSIGKEYHYQICHSPIQMPIHRRFSWHVPFPLDIDAMRKGFDVLQGCHDFSAFCNERTLWKGDCIRNINTMTIASLENGRIQISIIGTHFVYKMVRNLVGTLIYIGLGKIPLHTLPHILASKDRKLAGVTAPAHGLFLKKVFY
ncbi:MAG: tRNA pseudouridine(38-40) synthase TruA [Anaerolineae bacterium]